MEWKVMPPSQRGSSETIPRQLIDHHSHGGGGILFSFSSVALHTVQPILAGVRRGATEGRRGERGKKAAALFFFLPWLSYPDDQQGKPPSTMRELKWLSLEARVAYAVPVEKGTSHALRIWCVG